MAVIITTTKAMIGKRFGRWTVLKQSGTYRRPGGMGARPCILCRCDCGSKKVIDAHSVRYGHSRSCGCLRKEITAKRRTIHGNTNTVEYTTWKSMRQRCNNPNDPNFMNYGGRGITICERWQESFKSFLMDMGHRPSNRHSLDRVDNDGQYSPDNCRWATRKQQRRNRRKWIMIDKIIHGNIMTVRWQR